MYFMVKIELSDQIDTGSGKSKTKKWVEYYLVEDDVILGAEEKINKEFSGSIVDWKITGITQSSVVKVLQ